MRGYRILEAVARGERELLADALRWPDCAVAAIAAGLAFGSPIAPTVFTVEGAIPEDVLPWPTELRPIRCDVFKPRPLDVRPDGRAGVAELGARGDVDRLAGVIARTAGLPRARVVIPTLEEAGDNALKYGRGPVYVAWRVDQGTAALAVGDPGPGIAARAAHGTADHAIQQHVSLRDHRGAAHGLGRLFTSWQRGRAEGYVASGVELGQLVGPHQELRWTYLERSRGTVVSVRI